MLLSSQNPYKQTSVQTATPQQLLIMLYDGAIRFCKKAIQGLKDKQYDVANEAFIRAQAIVNELTVTLDRSFPISDELAALYEYFNRRLIEANVKKDEAPAEEILSYLTELKETWAQAAKINTSQGAR